MLNAPHTIAKVTNQQGAIPISLLNSHFHSSIGTLHSKTCITLPALVSAAKHDNQVNTFTAHFLSHSESQDKSQTCKFWEHTHALSCERKPTGTKEATVTTKIEKKNSLHISPPEENTNATSCRHMRIKEKPSHRGTHTNI